VADDLKNTLDELCQRTGAIGAVLCDDEGETVTAALGPQPISEGAEARARDHIPRSMQVEMPVGEFLVRLVGAECCGLVRMVDRVLRDQLDGPLSGLHLRYRDLDLLLQPLPEDFYLLVLLRRPLLLPVLQMHVRDAHSALAAQLS
jgi:hypothetical protein